MIFIAALRLDGIIAPLVLDGQLNGAWFLAYVECTLAPTINAGDILIMGNLGSHKAKATRQAIRHVAQSSSSCRLFAEPVEYYRRSWLEVWIASRCAVVDAAN